MTAGGETAVYGVGEMGRSCGTYGEQEKCWTVLIGKHEGTQLKDLDVDGRTILKRILKKGGRVWIRALVSAVMNLRVT